MLYESYIHPLTILSTLPSAGVGALLALMLFQTEFSIIALIGVILLIGIVKKNAIMMIDFAIAAERKSGTRPEQAIFEACLLRFRPIMMTTMAALLGAMPLAFGFGDGSEMRRPLGIAIVGGLIMSQLLTLYTTPVVYLYLDRLRLWLETPPARRQAHVVGGHDEMRLFFANSAGAGRHGAAERLHGRPGLQEAAGDRPPPLTRKRATGSPRSRATPSAAAPGGRFSATRN